MGSYRAITSVTITAPCLYYLLQPGPEKSHEHGHEHGEEVHKEHDRHSQEAEEGEEAGIEGNDGDGVTGSNDQDAEGEKSDESAGGTGGDKSEDSESEGGDQQATPDTSEDEGSENVAHEKGKGGGDVDGVQFKGATNAGDENNEQTDTRKHIPDAKGYNKLRIESDYGNKQGESDEEDGTRDESGRIADKVRFQRLPWRLLRLSRLTT